MARPEALDSMRNKLKLSFPTTSSDAKAREDVLHADVIHLPRSRVRVARLRTSRASSTTCLTQVIFKRDEQCSTLW